MTEQLIIAPKGGLGNRLRVVFSYLIVALQSDRSLTVNWEVDRYCPAHFLDVFRPIAAIAFSDAKPQIKTSRRADVKFSLYIPALKLLKPLNLPEIQQKTQEWGDFSAVHIRRTDHIQLAKKNGRYVDLDYFEDFIRKQDKCFLATDCQETQKYLLGKYPQILVWRRIEESRRLRQTELRDSVSDMWCCIGAAQFLGTPFSSFSDLIQLLRRGRRRR